MNWIWDNAEKLGALATVVGAISAIFAIGFAAGQIMSNRVATREATALKEYTAHVRSCIDRPHLCSWARFSQWSGYKHAREALSAKDEKSENYYWFVCEMLIVCELILEAADRDKNWRATVEAHVLRHAEFMTEFWPTWRERFSPALDKIVRRTLG